jgi:hypothetical protein
MVALSEVATILHSSPAIKIRYGGRPVMLPPPTDANLFLLSAAAVRIGASVASQKVSKVEEGHLNTRPRPHDDFDSTQICGFAADKIYQGGKSVIHLARV